jgi:hypothetical protein
VERHDASTCPQPFKSIDDRFKALEDTMNARFATLDVKIDGLEKRLDLVQHVALLEAKVEESNGNQALREAQSSQVPCLMPYLTPT